jgi:hypothetical protein
MVAFEKDPRGHWVHEADRVTSVCEPAGHCKHEEPLVVESRKVLKPQSVHTVAPYPDEYVPKGHCTHICDLSNSE